MVDVILNDSYFSLGTDATGWSIGVGIYDQNSVYTSRIYAVTLFYDVMVSIFSLGTDAADWSIGVGIHDQNSVYTSNVMRVRRVTVHEHYNPDQQKNDIALIRLTKTADINGQ